MRRLAAGLLLFLAAGGASAEGQSAQAHLQRARLLAQRGDMPAAAESLRHALSRAPNSEEVLAAYARFSLVTRAPVPAIAALEPLTRLCPSVGEYHYLLGVALMQAGDMSTAVDALREAERRDPERVLTLVALGLALNNRKLHAEARPFLLRALEREPENVDGMAALSESEEGLDDRAAAEAHAQRALDRAPAHPTANLVMGLLRLKQERFAEARDALQRAVDADPDSPKAHYQLSLAHARLGDTAAAEKHLGLYREKLQAIEERIERLRREGGFSGGIAS